MILHIWFLMMPLGWAQSCADMLSAPIQPSIELSQERPLTLTQVEVFRRNNRIGVQQLGEIRLERWIAVPPIAGAAANLLGLSADGRLYHIIDWSGERRIARLLSGEQEFQDFFFIDHQILAAVDHSGRVFLYSHKAWRSSPLKDVFKRGMALWAGVYLATTTTLYLAAPEAVQWNLEISGLTIPLPASFLALASGLQTALVMANRYDRLNTLPNGFLKTDFVISQKKDLPEIAARLSQEMIKNTLLKEDLSLPDRSTLSPPLPETATEEIRQFPMKVTKPESKPSGFV